jgi:hypothetical protein
MTYMFLFAAQSFFDTFRTGKHMGVLHVEILVEVLSSEFYENLNKKTKKCINPSMY